jgi:serine/threonine-protein phosphatase PGAM5
VIRYFVMRALQLPPEAWLRLAVSNASVTVLNIYPSGRVSLYSLGDVGHLPPSLITYN